MTYMVLALYLSLAGAPVITLERTGCYGPCPVYKLAIFDDGRVLYEGREFVKQKGKAESQISATAVRELVREFDQIDYFNLADEYTSEGKNCPEWWTDHPSAVTSLDWEGRKKTIRHYQGCRGARVLDQLTALENKIDEVVNTKRWIE